MCEFTQGIRGSYQNAGVMMCLVVTYKQYVLKMREKIMRSRSIHRIFIVWYSTCKVCRQIWDGAIVPYVVPSHRCHRVRSIVLY